MKKAALLSLSLALSLLLTSTPSRAQGAPQGTYQLDVTIEGPWILYIDPSFKTTSADNVGYPALVLMTPGVAGIPAGFQHQQPTINSGDGYWIPTASISCLTFADTCDLQRNPKTTSGVAYPKFAPLPVETAVKWRWYEDTAGTKATYLILPIPDSYSNDGVWPMQFAAASNDDGKGYKSEGDELHSIGLHLHYAVATAKINILGCDYPLKNSSADSCNQIIQKTKTLANSGTLRITMKAPYIDDVCDQHVRAAYRNMLTMLDPAGLTESTAGQTNANKGVIFIDPARSVDMQGKISYEDQNSGLHCREQWDPKLPKSNHRGAYDSKDKIPMAGESHMSSSWHEAIDLWTEIGKVKEYSKKLVLEKEQESRFKRSLDAFVAAGDELDTRYPRISKLDELATLADHSDSLLSELDLHLNEFRQGKDGWLTDAFCSQTADKNQILKCTARALKRFLLGYTTQTKDGKDCRAVIAWVGPTPIQ